MEASLLNASDVAAHFGVSVRTVRRWVADGEIEHTRTPGGHLRFPPTVLTTDPKDAA